MSKHGGKDNDRRFDEYFEVEIINAYMKPFKRCVEEGTLIASHKGEILSSESEWHQATVKSTLVVQGGVCSTF